MRIDAHGLSIDVPVGWEARIAQLPPNAPVLHVASFPLQAGDGAFGAGATARMGADDAFAALVEYRVQGDVEPGTGLFAPSGFDPHLRAPEFAAAQLEYPTPGRLGVQRFFTQKGHPFCLFAVIRPVNRSAPSLAAELSGVLATLRFS